MCGRIIAPIFTTAGFASWQAGVALITGVLAKEIVVATFGAIMGTGAGLTAALHSVFTPLSAISFMVFALLYMPCLPTIAVMRTEAKWKWTVVIVSYTVIFALTAATVVYQVGRLMGFH
jgi:ferrous iron transport protein B